MTDAYQNRIPTAMPGFDAIGSGPSTIAAGLPCLHE